MKTIKFARKFGRSEMEEYLILLNDLHTNGYQCTQFKKIVRSKVKNILCYHTTENVPGPYVQEVLYYIEEFRYGVKVTLHISKNLKP